MGEGCSLGGVVSEGERGGGESRRTGPRAAGQAQRQYPASVSGSYAVIYVCL